MTVPTHVVPAAAAGVRLVDHVREHLAVVAARRVGPLIADGAIQVDGRRGRIAELLSGGETLSVDPEAISVLVRRREAIVPEPADLVVVHEDQHVLVVDKPSGMHVHPMGRHRSGTLVGALLWHAGARPDDPWAAWRPYPGHRLDRPTSGLLAVPKRREHQDAFRRALDRGEVRRVYEAVVEGDVAGDEGTIVEPLGPDPSDPYRRAVVPVDEGGQPAVTHWRVLERTDGRTRLEVTLGTGRTHQVRAHLAALGHPVLGDELYRGGSSTTAIALRAVQLAFPHPASGDVVEVRAP